jgi:GNAT superfamily N-acetyltransferase
MTHFPNPKNHSYSNCDAKDSPQALDVSNAKHKMAQELGCAEAVALLLERADTQHILHQVQAHASIKKGPDSPAAIIKPIAGGLVVLTDPEYGQKLNRAVGLGLSAPATDSDLDDIESLFEETHTTPNFHLAGIVRGDLKQRLIARGYAPNGSVNVYYMDLKGYTSAPRSDQVDGRHSNIEVHEVMPNPNGPTTPKSFHDVSVEGFRSGGRLPKLLSHLAELALQRDDTEYYFAYVNGKLAGSAAMAILKVPESLEASERTDDSIQPCTTVAQLYLDSTLPEFRGQGVHAALIHERIRSAKSYASVVMLVARAGSGSARNALRAGMKLAYEKQILSR